MARLMCVHQIKEIARRTENPHRVVEPTAEHWSAFLVRTGGNDSANATKARATNKLHFRVSHFGVRDRHSSSYTHRLVAESAVETP